MSIATEITRLQTAKSNLKTSIENKGVTVPSATKLDGYASLVDQISGGSISNTDAILIVTVPTGSTVIATKNGVTLIPTIWVNNADNALDTAIFIIKASTFDANAWTVTSTLGQDSITESIVINSAKEYSIILAHFSIGDLIPTMTSSTTPSGEVTASSYTSTSYPYYAFDNNTSTHWYSGNPLDYTNRYIQYYFGKYVKITSVNISISNYTGTNSITKPITILTSNDGINFDKQYSENVTCPANASTIVGKTMQIPTTVCKYLRIKFDNITAFSGSYPSFQVYKTQARNDA